MAIPSSAICLQRPRELPVPEFRAPPPSPVTGVLTGSSSGSSGYGECQDDDEIGKFLRCSARVPVLQLPEMPVPRRNNKKAARAPPVVDMRLLEPDSLSPVDVGGSTVEALRSAAVAFGCFQVIGHGVDGGLLSAAWRAVEPKEASPASETEGIGGDGDDDDDELWWSPGEGGDQETAGNPPLRNDAKEVRYELSMRRAFDFAGSRNRADELFAQLEQASAKLLHALLRQGSAAEPLAEADSNTSRLCIRKHLRSGGSTPAPISQDDVLRMLARSSRCPRALAVHLCPGASAFHVFSRRGWSRFRPLDGTAVVTVGDELQAWSHGLYKSVSGKPAYNSNDLRDGYDAISAEFFLHRSSAGTANRANVNTGKVVPLNLQIMVAACLVLVYHFLSCLYAIR
ncbi:hypothetical protein U9M48_017748 [Paspalum notatum var. saurae]|uniref:Non-haem dioxygenase N-terminal domain-containing protein n=1 Tax=Paspalum notatum var. saurae TaxID=547442 RepID=A0AAQ3T973_PASNO